MTLAITSDNGMVSAHLGHCQEFVFFEVEGDVVGARSSAPNESHEMGMLPGPLRSRHIDCVITGGMGPRARQNFEAAGVEVILGVTGPVEEAAAAFAAGDLERGESFCNHE